ncbi:COBRA-like protein 7 [Macadamia integrifolia]|uniref:COBRA-like protein 7 n=1 Tax=Macadamia integrifolia TaxID=60698 RepID=UPI001C4F19FE|nr:COBRA-like protein 7 [Macadamia integrifolia]
MGIIHLHRIFKPLFLFLFFFAISLRITIAQPAAPSPSADACNGVFLSYQYTSGHIIPPRYAAGSPLQPYKFQSTLTILNNGLNDLKSWQVFVGFQHNEYLVSASNAVLVDGTSLPASVENGTAFAGYPATDLKTAIETAGDLTQMQAVIDLVGTTFGVSNVSMPSNISLVNANYICPQPTMQGTSEMIVCCTLDPTVKVNTTSTQKFLPRQSGDLVITYDVTQSLASSYLAQVTISNNNPLGRLDYWMLSWDWMRGEFIGTMKGAYPTVVDTTECLYGPQGTYYQGIDFSSSSSSVLNCDRRPTIVDLPPQYANDSTLGKIPYCCRNGTILPYAMDSSKSTSVFQLQVYKMPPDLNRTTLYPPQNFMINGTFNPDYRCGPPVRVTPTEFPDPMGLPSNVTALASWQVVCNMTQPTTPKCCVSFSSYLNDSVIPCKTCACGCQSNPSHTCSATTPALLLPPDAALVPFANRTNLTTAWAQIKHWPVPSPMPCGDNCGVSINWHLYTDYSTGWSARVTLFNWGGNNFADWFAAVKLDKATPGFQAMYSFNASVLPGINGVNNTIFMQGLSGLNYLVAEAPASDPKANPPVPGKQQSVISFTVKNIPNLDLLGGDAFPSKVFFNGLECSIPSLLPSKGDRMVATSAMSSFLLAVVVLIFVQR